MRPIGSHGADLGPLCGEPFYETGVCLEYEKEELSLDGFELLRS